MLAERLRLQGYTVSLCRDGAEGAYAALEDPPSAVVADLRMPSISGVQLCRLLKAEPATENVPVILRGPDGHRNRFWAEQAGATHYVVKGRMGDLVRALARAIEQRIPDDGFFFAMADAERATGNARPSQMYTEARSNDVRDRIAAHLDAALFDSVIAAEVRKLGVCGSFDRLFDLLSQFMTQVTNYRWLALTTYVPARLGVHANPADRPAVLSEVCQRLKTPDDVRVLVVEDEDAHAEPPGAEALVSQVLFGDRCIGELAIGPRGSRPRDDMNLVETIARELGGPLQMATLVEESQRLATVDPLTGLLNRRAFTAEAEREVARCQRYGEPLSLLLLDVDHFKQVNDRRGHATGDLVLQSVGRLLLREARTSDRVARWGGEEFVVALAHTGLDGAGCAAERIRAALEAHAMVDLQGEALSVTCSVGIAELTPTDTLDALIDRADRAMYRAKGAGRNRVERGLKEAPPAPSNHVEAASLAS